MPWYGSGAVAVTANSATVTGTGTAFSANSRVGDAFRGPDGLWYEVTNIASATVLSIKPNYQGATASGQAYAIAPMQGYVKESADRLRQFVDQYGVALGNLAGWATAASADEALTALGFSASGKVLASGTPAQGLQALGALSTTGTAADSSKLGGRAAADYETLYGRSGTAGALGFRNKIINGDMRVNQRGFNGVWGNLAEGAYGYDRWKRSGTNIQQVIEAGNFTPNAVHTLSGSGVVTQQITSPASGHWTVTVPNSATYVQLEEGFVATPFEHRPVGLGLSLCQRYYEVGSLFSQSPAAASMGGQIGYSVPKRTAPTFTFTNISYNGTHTLIAQPYGYTHTGTGFNYQAVNTSGYLTANWIADAEL